MDSPSTIEIELAVMAALAAAELSLIAVGLLFWHLFNNA
jgi:hypothetical protein